MDVSHQNTEVHTPDSLYAFYVIKKCEELPLEKKEKQPFET